jgi:hypothetical protein
MPAASEALESRIVSALNEGCPMSAWLRIAWLLVLVLVVPHSAFAASDSPEARALLVDAASEWLPGDRIRVVSPEPYRVGTTGWYSSLDGDTAIRMRMSRSEPPVKVGLYQIGALEQKVGTKRHVATGAVVGLVVGTVAGVLYANSHGEEEFEIPAEVLTPRPIIIRTKGLKQTYIAIGAASGLVLGGVAGFLIQTDRFGIVATFD